MGSAFLTDDDPEFERLWRGFRVVGGTVVAAVLGAAFVLAHLWVSTHPADNTLSDYAGHTPSALRPEKLPRDRLTGVGATIAGFDAAHGPPLEHGQFGPTFADGVGGRTATYDAGNSTSVDIVDTLFHAFPPRTSEASALADIRTHDLPADARLVRTASLDHSCYVAVYRSAIIADSGPYEDFGVGTVVVKLSRPDHTYSVADVQLAEETVGETVAVNAC